MKKRFCIILSVSILSIIIFLNGCASKKELSDKQIKNTGTEKEIISQTPTPASTQTKTPAATEAPPKRTPAVSVEGFDPSKIQPASSEQRKKAMEKYNEGFKVYMQYKEDEAIKLMDEAIALDPLCYQAYNVKGAAQCFRHQFSEGFKNIKKAILINPDDVYPYFNMGLGYKLKKDYKTSLVWFDRAIAMNTRENWYAWSYFGKACIYAEWKKDADKTVANLKKAFEVGYGTINQAKTEKDLDPVRNTAQFKTLMEQYK